MRQIPDSSVPSLIPHVQESVEAGRDWAICRWKSCDSADHAIPICAQAAESPNLCHFDGAAASHSKPN